jgi:glycosyltransferase 2 family protein
VAVAPVAPDGGLDDVEIVEPERAPYVRRPSDLLRLLIGLGALLVGLLIALLAQDAIVSFNASLLRFVDGIGRTRQHIIQDGVGAFVAAVVLVAILVLILLRHWRALVYLVVADVVAERGSVLMAHGVHHLEPRTFSAHTTSTFLPSGAFHDTGVLAGLVAIVTVTAPWMSRRWRRLAWLAIVLAAAIRLATSSSLPAAMFFEAALGWVVGSAVLLGFGAPNPRATARAIAAALNRAGFDVTAVHVAAVDARASVPYFVTGRDGDHLFVKVLGVGQRDADLLFRLYRWVRFRDIGDERPFGSVRRAVEHETLLGFKARDTGTRTPRPRAIADVDAPGGAVLLAADQVRGRSLDAVDAADITDDVLHDMWVQVKSLHDNRIAHRDLRLANLLLDDEDKVWIIDFGFGEMAAAASARSDDVAGLLASTALVVGAERAVAAPRAVLGPEPIADALPRMQPSALSGATTTALKKQPELLGELRTTAQAASGVENVELERLARIRMRTVAMFVALGAAVYFLYPQLADIDTMFEEIKHASIPWALVAVAASALTYVGATISMMGAVPTRLPALHTFNTQVASSFANRLTPAQAGGYAVNIRFLRKNGVETSDAITGVGLNSLGGLIVHLSLTGVFAAWAGTSDFGGKSLKPPAAFIYILVVLLVIAIALVVSPFGRRLLTDRVIPAARRARHGLVEVARRPSKLAALLGGSAIVTMSSMVALAASLHAFGGDLPFARIGFTYLAASAVASAVPTPGGLGGAEAAYAAGLTLAGVDKTVALSTVFLFRAATFWLPILPGWLLYRYEQRRGDL